MKKRLVLLAVILVVVGISLRLWLKARRDTPLPVSSPVTSDNSAAQPPPNSLGGKTSSPTAQQPADKLTSVERRMETINAREQAREKDVEFWGKVIDQRGEPVAGVEVTATITSHQLPPPGFKSKPTTIYSEITDASGVFYIKGPAGRGFTIETMKRYGYVLPPELQKRTNNLHWYNYDQLDPKSFKPDALAPIVFKMWKIGKSEKLIQSDDFYGITPDGSAYTLDLLAKKHARGEGMGDIRVKINRPLGIKFTARGYDWSCEIDGVNGGVIETQDEFMYNAPENGYQSRYEIKISATDLPWSDEVKKQFYLKSRDGKVYARLDVKIYANYQDVAALRVKYYANQSGSRNLEYDPEEQLQNVFKSRLKPPANTPVSNP